MVRIRSRQAMKLAGQWLEENNQDMLDFFRASAKAFGVDEISYDGEGEEELRGVLKDGMK